MPTRVKEPVNFETISQEAGPRTAEAIRSAFAQVQAGDAKARRDAKRAVFGPAAFANLPSARIGQEAIVTDSTVNTYGSVIAGGGANTVRAWFNGTNWVVG